ncbi:MAG: beta-glucosidase, partial [Bacteroidetes bacterium]|nr:beta-glucosidase [Bacteroidota bacterium]
GGTYDGSPLSESDAEPSDLTDQQKQFLEDDNLRHVLITTAESPAVAAQWNNNAQAFVEGLGLGVPMNTSSDPRHETAADAEFNEGAGGDISMWPGSLGLAATFNPDATKEFARIASIEYRALGVTTALSPQIDMATDPRWMRVSGTFGEDSQLSADMARAYVDGFQSSSEEQEISGGWGYESVNAMVKHWPGGGSGEGGRDAHYGFGKYAVYPGNNFDEMLIPFTEGAFNLNGETGMASAVMPYYTISVGQSPEGEDVANAYSDYIIRELLRDKYGFDGVVCTDWGVTGDHNVMDSFIDGKPWGVEDLTVAERHYRVIMSGGDQFGGNNEAGPVVGAYEIGVDKHGEEFMRARFERSAVRLLKNIFRVGLFENPYLVPEESSEIVGNPDFMKQGYETQLNSIVMLKNKENVLPVEDQLKVYVPKRTRPQSSNFLGMPIPAIDELPVSEDILNQYYNLTDNPEEADFAIVFIESPNSGRGYDSDSAEYVPISLQYRPYTATKARNPSLAGGDPLEDSDNRSYRGQTVQSVNESDLDSVLETREAMGKKPVIVAINVSNPMVFSEFEELIDGIIVHFGVQDQALLDIISGTHEPSALLPLQMPADMATVENQAEDTPHDMETHIDSEGNNYDFGFGLNWDGIISDERVNTYTE